MDYTIIGKVFNDRGTGMYWEYWGGYCWEANVDDAMVFGMLHGRKASERTLAHLRAVDPTALIVRLLITRD